jgi:hypothetical protein
VNPSFHRYDLLGTAFLTLRLPFDQLHGGGDIMTVKTATGVALAAACLMSFAAIPGAKAQTSYGPQTYQGNSSPGSATGLYGSTTGNYAPQAQGNANPNSTMGSYGSTTGNYTPQPSAAGVGDTEAVSNEPQGSPPSSWSARRNVVESERYDRLLEGNRRFREARMRRECGPITDPQLHQQCLDSFAQYEPAGGNMPASGSSTPSRHYRSNSGR